MSFILDALKKSESERQQQAGAEFSDVPSRPGEPPSFKWLWILAVILLVNLVVLLAILFRPQDVSEPAAAVGSPAMSEPASVPKPAAKPTFEERVAEARRTQPPVSDPEIEAELTASVSNPPSRPSSSADAIAVLESGRPARQPAPSQPTMKTFTELRLEGALQLVDLHIDIHVYADEPAERFVFINMNKYTENSTLAEGPVVKEITTDGAILEHQGVTFLLSRE